MVHRLLNLEESAKAPKQIAADEDEVQKAEWTSKTAQVFDVQYKLCHSYARNVVGGPTKFRLEVLFK